MTACRILLAIGIILEALAAFNLKDWAEEKLQVVQRILGAIMPRVAAGTSWLLDRMTVILVPTMLIMLLIAFAVGGKREAMTGAFINILVTPLLLGTIAVLVAICILLIVCILWAVLRVLAYTPRGILAGVGLLSLLLGFTLDCK